MLAQVSPIDGREPEVTVRIGGQAGPVVPGGAVTRSLLVQRPLPGGPDTVTVRWSPPSGAAGIAFPDLQPPNPQGPAPDELAPVPGTAPRDPEAAPALTVAYAAPAPPQPAAGPTFVDCFTAETASGNEYSATFVDTVVGTGTGSLAAAGGRSAAAGAVASLVGGYRWWQAAITLAPAGDFPLDETLCGEWGAFLQDPAFFVAIRFPETPAPGDGRSAPLPLVTPEPGFTSPYVELRATDLVPPAVFTAALELRPERIEVATAILPPAAGERWVTLGVAAEPPAVCPEGLTGGWEVHGELAFDFGGDDESCRECVLEQYLCYEGEAPPFFFAEAAQAAGGVSVQSTVRAAGVTCAGPIPLRLAGDPPAPPIALEGAGLGRTGSNALVKLAHTLRAWLAPDEHTDVTLAVESSKGLPWKLYRASALTDQIAGPVTISGPAQFDFWASTRTPFGFRGQESITVTASDAAPAGGEVWTTDHLWAGAWTPPPPPAVLIVDPGAIYAGMPVTVSGTLPDGDYRLVVVPNGAWVPGDCYTGDALAAADVTVVDGTLPPTPVWAAATIGGFDVLALSGACGGAAAPAAGAAALAADDAVIVAGDDCSLSAGVEVTERPTPARPPPRRPGGRRGGRGGGGRGPGGGAPTGGDGRCVGAGVARAAGPHGCGYSPRAMRRPMLPALDAGAWYSRRAARQSAAPPKLSPPRTTR